MKLRYKVLIFLILLLLPIVSFIFSLYIFLIVVTLEFLSLLLVFLAKFLTFEYDFHIQLNEDNYLKYYIDSSDLFGFSLNHKCAPRVRFVDGIPQILYKDKEIGWQCNPHYVCWWGLLNINRYVDTNQEIYLNNFNRQVKWLIDNSQESINNSIVWQFEFDWKSGNTFLKAPWVSAMTQGLAISVLIRAYRISRDSNLLQIAKRAVRIYEVPIEQGGIKTNLNGYSYYEEYPAYPLTLVLDGFIFSLLGLYDLFIETKEENVRTLFEEGISCLINNLEIWNFRNFWSRYGNLGMLSNNQYNKLNASLLQVLSRITKNYKFSQVAISWDPKNLNLYKKLVIFLHNLSYQSKLDLQRVMKKINNIL